MNLILGDCLEKLKEIPNNSIDSIVTDPPYGLSFMGKKWDYDVPSVEIWKECLRVLKPGGHALIACGTRTQHRMALNIEDAGFEIRDVITWLYGSGFPKSLDVSKAIDKAAGAEREIIGMAEPRGREGRKAPQGQGLPTLESNGFSNLQPITTPSTDAAKKWAGWGTALKPSTEHWTLARKPLSDWQNLWYETHKLCQYLLSVFPVEKLSLLNLSESGEGLSIAPCSAEKSINTLEHLSEQMATLPSKSEGNSSLSIALLWRNILAALLRRGSTFTTETVSSLTIDLRTLSYLLSKHTQESTTQAEIAQNGGELNAESVESYLRNVLIKLSCTQIIDAQSGVGLSPNAEFWTLARKPLGEKTVAANVQKYGTGGINIDGCRIAGAIPVVPQPSFNTTGAIYNMKTGEGRNGEMSRADGRFPANLILNEEAARLLDEQVGFLHGAGNKAAKKPEGKTDKSVFGVGGDGTPSTLYDRGGSASRFFYVAKASKSERNAGCEGLNAKFTATMNGGIGGREHNPDEPTAYNKNHHPTVKPIKLMRYLCRLICPPGGVVLDPFAGSGSTLVAAKQEGFSFIGIEREAEYFKICEARIKSKDMQESLGV